MHQWNVSVEQGLGIRWWPELHTRVLSAATCFIRRSSTRPCMVRAPIERTQTSAAPVREFTQINFAGTYGRSNYHAFVLSLERRMSSGLRFLAGFSWQKTMDLNSGTAFEGNGGTHPYSSIDRDYGVSTFHRAARFTGSFNYQLPSPIRSNALKYVTNGWQMNGIVSLQSGAPLTIATGVDNSFSGIGQDRVDIWETRS